MGLELAEQFDWQLPDVILYPTGGGTGLIGMWKAFAELTALGWLKPGKLPRMVSVQSDGCAPIVRAFEAGERFAKPFQNARTIASGLRVPGAVGDFMILDAIRASGGTAPGRQRIAAQRMAAAGHLARRNPDLSRIGRLCRRTRNAHRPRLGSAARTGRDLQHGGRAEIRRSHPQRAAADRSGAAAGLAADRSRHLGARRIARRGCRGKRQGRRGAATKAAFASRLLRASCEQRRLRHTRCIKARTTEFHTRREPTCVCDITDSPSLSCSS